MKTALKTALVLTGIVALALAPVIAGCGKAPSEQTGGSTADSQLSGKLAIGGSTTVLPLAQAGAEQFMAANPGVKVEVQGTGSSEGIKGVTDGVLQIGDSSRDLKPEEETLGLVDHKVAIDALALITDPANPVKDLSEQQVIDVLTGKIANWKEVGGPDKAIVVVGRDEASGTREYVQKDIIGEKASFAKGALALPGAGQVKATVAQTPGSVGYVGLGAVDDSVKTLKVDGVAPSAQTVKDGTYTFQRALHMFTKGKPNKLAGAYLAFVLSGKFQKETVASEFVPVK